ncbi:MAG: hypothetical protein M3273_05265, partial [Actinomycetota bacterium]|nr:hypothetical protein [Actinomycetota bacterium]
MHSKSKVRISGLLVVALLMGLPAAASSRAETPKKRKGPVEIALRHLGVNSKSAKVTDLYTSNHNRVTHVYLRQVVKGTETIGAEATVNIQD